MTSGRTLPSSGTSAASSSLKNAIAVGIGLLIALIGLEYGGLVVDAPGVLVGIGDLTSKPVVLVLFGVILISVLMALRIHGAILIGILVTAILGVPLGIVKYHGIIASPPSVSSTLFQLDILGALKTGLITVIFIFFFLDLFSKILPARSLR